MAWHPKHCCHFASRASRSTPSKAASLGQSPSWYLPLHRIHVSWSHREQWPLWPSMSSSLMNNLQEVQYVRYGVPYSMAFSWILAANSTLMKGLTKESGIGWPQQRGGNRDSSTAASVISRVTQTLQYRCWHRTCTVSRTSKHAMHSCWMLDFPVLRLEAQDELSPASAPVNETTDSL